MGPSHDSAAKVTADGARERAWNALVRDACLRRLHTRFLDRSRATQGCDEIAARTWRAAAAELERIEAVPTQREVIDRLLRGLCLEIVEALKEELRATRGPALTIPSHASSEPELSNRHAPEGVDSRDSAS